MENWEKDYLDSIKLQKELQLKRSGTLPHQKEYDDSLWEEQTRPDGSKVYVPKMDVIRKQRSRAQASKTFSSVIRGIRKVAIAALLITAVIYIIPELKNADIKENISESVSDFTTGLRIPNTYLNGIGLANMVNTLWDIKESQTDKLNSFIDSGYSFSDEEMILWLDSISSDLTTVKELTYHPSYSEVIDGYISLLSSLKEFVVYAAADNRAMMETTHAQYVSWLSEVNTLLARAFEKNNVEYTLTAKSLYFKYHRR